MNREKAAYILDGLAERLDIQDIKDWRDAVDALLLGVAALRGPVPDPITGLMPCGCGGKARLGKLQYTIADPDLMPEYYAYCRDCGITTENSADRERVEAAWNLAMGYEE